MQKRRSNRTQFIAALGFSTIVSIGLLLYGGWRNHNYGFNYLIWNLFLAWIPLVLAFKLMRVLSTKLWSSWEGLFWSVLWLIFLPNSFYLISDFIHLQHIKYFDILYAVIMFTSFIFTGIVLGFSSLYLIHIKLRHRLPTLQANFYIGLTLFICSIAVYIGRDLRWNSWDIFTNPGGLLFDISDRLQHPEAYPSMLMTIIIFFILLISIYSLLWNGIKLIRNPSSH